MTQEIKRPYVYMVTGKNEKMEEYSGRFSTTEDALTWKNSPEKGIMLQHIFRRKLILVYQGEPI